MPEEATSATKGTSDEGQPAGDKSEAGRVRCGASALVPVVAESRPKVRRRGEYPSRGLRVVPEGGWQCVTCDRIWPQAARQVAERHAATHLSESERPHQCPEVGCGRGFSTLAGLQGHARVHLGRAGGPAAEARPFACTVPFCDARFAFRGARERHALLHQQNEAGRPFECTECTARFRQRTHLAAHVETRHAGPAARDGPGSRLAARCAKGCGRIFCTAGARARHEGRCRGPRGVVRAVRWTAETSTAPEAHSRGSVRQVGQRVVGRVVL